jgi:hypothetical protein
MHIPKNFCKIPFIKHNSWFSELKPVSCHQPKQHEEQYDPYHQLGRNIIDEEPDVVFLM